ncbi:MAG TPA: hypothetical protein VND40_06500 [Nitrososphaerales archaeon]|nr:hypothetical protein [Nitrososphaerales archaeon]
MRRNRRARPGPHARSRPPLLRPRTIASQIKREPNELKKKLLLVGYLAELLSRKGEALFLVGGQAVETYTAGQFTTGDVDVTATDKELTERTLARMGFTKQGMVWLNAKMGIAVHVVGSYPSHSEKVRTIAVGPYTVSVVGVEDLIVDRLVGAKHWKSARDAEQAVVLFNSFEESIDAEYLKRRAREERVDDILPKSKMK